MSFNDRDGVYTIHFQDGRIKLLDCTGAEVQPGTARTIARILFDQNQIDTCVDIGKTQDKLKVVRGEDALRMKPERDNLTGQEIDLLVKIKCRGALRRRSWKRAFTTSSRIWGDKPSAVNGTSMSRATPMC